MPTTTASRFVLVPGVPGDRSTSLGWLAPSPAPAFLFPVPWSLFPALRFLVPQSLSPLAP